MLIVTRWSGSSVAVYEYVGVMTYFVDMIGVLITVVCTVMSVGMIGVLYGVVCPVFYVRWYDWSH